MTHWNPSSRGGEPSWADRPPDEHDQSLYSAPPEAPGQYSAVSPYPPAAPNPGPPYPAPPPQDEPAYGPPSPYGAPAPYDQQPADPYEQPPIWAGRQAPAPPMWEDPQPPKAYLRQQPSPPGPGRRARAVIAVAAAAVVLAAGGGVLVFELRSHHAHAGAAGVSHPPASTSQQEQPSPTASPTRAHTAPPSPRGTPGSATVAVAPAAARDPAAPQVVNLLTRYFTAINGHDYPAYLRLLDPQMQRIQTARRFSEGFKSTTDSGATLTGLSRTPDGRLAAAVSFTSHQSPAESPDQSACTHWTITLYLRPGGGGYLIGAPPSGYQASHLAC